MTVKFTCYGESDDLCEIEGDFYDENGVSSYDKHRRYLRINRKEDKGDGFVIVYHYEKNGCWTVAPMMLDEGIPIPEWALFRIIEAYHEYSMALECTLSGKKEEYEYAWLNDKFEEEEE